MVYAKWFFAVFLLTFQSNAFTFDEDMERSTATGGVTKPRHSSHVYPADLSWKHLIDFTYEDRLEHQNMGHYGFDEIFETTQGVLPVYMQYSQHLTPYMPFTQPIVITDDDWKDHTVPDNLKRSLKPFQNQSTKKSGERKAIQIAMYHESWPLKKGQFPQVRFAILYRDAPHIDGSLIDGACYGNYVTKNYIAQFFNTGHIATFTRLVSFKSQFSLAKTVTPISSLETTRLGRHLATLMASDNNYRSTIIRNKVRTRLFPNLEDQRYVIIEKLLRSDKKSPSSQFLLGHLHATGNIGHPKAPSRYKTASEWLDKSKCFGYAPRNSALCKPACKTSFAENKAPYQSRRSLFLV